MVIDSQMQYSYKNKYGIWQGNENTNTTTNMVIDSQMQYSYKNNYGIWQSNENTNTQHIWYLTGQCKLIQAAKGAAS